MAPGESILLELEFMPIVDLGELEILYKYNANPLCKMYE